MTVEPEKEAAYGGAAGPRTSVTVEELAIALHERHVADGLGLHESGVGWCGEEAAAVFDRLPVAGSLDAAWSAAEAALPPGGRLHLQRRAEAETIDTGDGKTWVARQGRAAGAYEAWATDSSKALGFAYDATPEAALRKLTRHLRAALADSGEAGPPDVLEGGA